MKHKALHEPLTREDIERALHSGLQDALKEIGARVRADVREEMQIAVDSMKHACRIGAEGYTRDMPYWESSPVSSCIDTVLVQGDDLSDDGETELVNRSIKGESSYQRIKRHEETNEGEDCLLDSDGIKALEQWEEFADAGRCESWQGFVKSRLFELIVGALILVNILLIGVDIHMASVSEGNKKPVVFEAFSSGMETLFCFFFLIEWISRVCVYGRGFVAGKGRARNIFDTFIIGLQVFEQALSFVAGESEPVHILRLLRVLRFLRLVPIYDNLKDLANSIKDSLSVLLPALSLLSMGIYIFSALFTFIAMQWGKNSQEMNYWFGSFPRAALTLLETIAGGVSWDEVCDVLLRDVGVVAGVVYLFYVCFGVFVMLNVIMGVFINKAIEAAQQQTDIDMACAISGAFIDMDVSRDVFNKKLGEADLQECFRNLNIDMSQAPVLFDLIDRDASGSVNRKEIVEGCLRLKGLAKALDVNIVERALYNLIDKIENHISIVHRELHSIGGQVSSLLNTSARPSLGNRRSSQDFNGLKKKVLLI